MTLNRVITHINSVILNQWPPLFIVAHPSSRCLHWQEFDVVLRGPLKACTLFNSNLTSSSEPSYDFAVSSSSAGGLCMLPAIHSHCGKVDHSICELSSYESFIDSVAVYWKHLNWKSGLGHPFELVPLLILCIFFLFTPTISRHLSIVISICSLNTVLIFNQSLDSSTSSESEWAFCFFLFFKHRPMKLNTNI